MSQSTDARSGFTMSDVTAY